MNANNLIAYEAGDLDFEQTLEFFSYLQRNGLLYGLQGSYARTFHQLVDAGYLSTDGEIL